MADQGFKTYSYRLTSRGVQAKYISDDAPPATYQNLLNLELRAENAISTRYGLYPITTNGTTNFPLGGTVYSLSKMQGIGQFYRYAGAASQLWRRVGGAQGAYTPIVSGLSGNPFSSAPYRPAASSTPYQFIADDAAMLKDSGSFSVAENWGINPPLVPSYILPTTGAKTFIESFDEGSTTSFTLTNIGSAGTAYRIDDTGTYLNSGFSQGPPYGPGPVVIIPGIDAVSTYARTSGVATLTGITSPWTVGMRVRVGNMPDESFNAASAIITAVGSGSISYANAGPNASGSGASGSFASSEPSYQVGMFLDLTSPGELVRVDGLLPNFFTATVGGSQVLMQCFVVTLGFSTSSSTTAISGQYVNGTIAANTTGSISKNASFNLGELGSIPPLVPSEPNDIIQFWLQVDNPLNLSQIVVTFDVGDGSFQQDYYAKTIIPAGVQPVLTGNVSPSQAQQDIVAGRAGGVIDVRSLGGDNPSILPADFPTLQSSQPFEMQSGINAWTLVTVRLAEFIPAGNAGNGINTWNNVVGWQISFTSTPNSTVNVAVDDMGLVGGAGLDSFAGQAYDYRYTYYNLNTGAESTPSVEMISTSALSVQRSAIDVAGLNPTDPQVTHIRIYRRGGTLTQAWYYVDQTPVSSHTANTFTVYTDQLTDAAIEVNPTLNIDADPPVTTLLPTQLNAAISGISELSPLDDILLVYQVTLPGVQPCYVNQLVTVGVGSTQEQARVMTVANVGGNTRITLVLQYTHTAGEIVAATTKPNTPMNLAAIAFDQAFLAGDPNNPHVLYYSLTYSPETFPQENFIEVGTPDAPIMALVVLRGFLYVFTTKTVYQIFGGQGSTPTAIPTGVMHGLVSNFGWAASENVVYYCSYDGIYAFQGSGSQYMTQPTEWVWTGKNLGPVPAIGPGTQSQILMAYANHELFVSYVDGSGNRHRQVWSEVYQRWRNDTAAVGNITAMYFEQDTRTFVVGKDDGMVYLDRVNDYDSGGYSGGAEIKNAIPFSLQTAQLDQEVPKAFKVYNECTLDATLNGNTVDVYAVFDDGNTVTLIGTATGTTRQQYQFNINSGNGYNSQNVGILLTGSVTVAPTFNEVHIRAVINAEYRESFDTWWMRFGSDKWKVGKQGYFEYIAPDAGGINVSVYAEGNMTTPIYTFNLPQSTNRIAKRMRFPAKKRKLWRFVGTSASPFQMYMPESMIEFKNVCAQTGYELGKLQP